MKICIKPTKQDWKTLLTRKTIDSSILEESVSSILADVKSNKDKSLRFYSKMFDRVLLENLTVTNEEFEIGINKTDIKLKEAIDKAAENITKFHKSQSEAIQKITTTKGVICWRENRGIEKVGLYIPGGTAPLFSTVLMLAIPAKIAGCKEIYLCTPPSKDGSIHPAILYASKVAGVSTIFKVGGAQAIAALAYGTETIPAVYKIFGPGNQYVTCAKQLISKEGIAIDMPAGPSEVAIIADESCIPAFVAADMLSQAEHGSDSQSILFTTSETIANAVEKEIQIQLERLPRKELTINALNNSKIIVLESIEDCVDISNEYAPEHLILSCKNSEYISSLVINAGSVFIGNYSPESAGDYASGTNHTLPTNGSAKAFSGVSLDSFVKKITFQQISETGLQNLGPIIEEMAAAEQLEAHKNAVTIRLNQINGK